MSQQSSQKRTADSNQDPLTSQTQHKSKKARFAEPSEDPEAFAEEVDSALENPSAKRKGRVKQEGYDSDSSDDEGSVELNRPKGDDGGEKGEKFLKIGDIEGQEFGQSESDDGSVGAGEPEDEDDAERLQKAEMGFEISSFNMREEMEEGKFAEDGTYVRTFDPHGVHDRWMDGLDDKDIKLARRAKRRQERQQKERIKAEELELEANGRDSLEKRLVPMLKKGETVLEALQRLGDKSKKTRLAMKKRDKTDRQPFAAMDVDKQGAPPSDIDQITHLASSLMSLGDTDIYSKTYEELVRSVRSSGSIEPSWVPPSADVKYEYKWDLPGSMGQASQTFGPFSEDEMRTWFKASYFGIAGEKVKVREAGGDWNDWDDIMT